MTEQQTDPTPPPQAGPQQGPRVSTGDVRDLQRLRRSSYDRYLGGVAGGLGRHLDVDPTVVRVALVVLTLFGGAGLILYVALWLFVPSDTSDRAPIRVGPEARVVVVIGAIVLAACVFLGSTFSDNGWGFGFPLVVVLVATAAVYLAVRDRRDTRERQTQPASTAPTPSGAAMSATDTQTPPPPAPPAWAPPTVPAYVPPPPRPRRTGLVLFWPTLALIAIALGTLGIVDASSSIPVSAYAALAVAITGTMLVVGAFVGRAGGLILLGLLTSFVMVVSSGVQAATGGATDTRTIDEAPTSAALVAEEYSVQNGDISIDLSGVTDPQALAGRITTIRLNAGEITVKVPRTIDVHVAADIRYAGHVDVGGTVRDGFGPTLDATLAATPASATTPTYELVVKARVGSITVEQD